MTNREMEKYNLAKPPTVPSTELEAAVHTVVTLCDGDQRDEDAAVLDPARVPLDA